MHIERIVREADKQLEIATHCKIASLAADDEKLQSRFNEEFKKMLTMGSMKIDMIEDEEFDLQDVDLLTDEKDISLLANEDGARFDSEIDRINFYRSSLINNAHRRFHQTEIDTNPFQNDDSMVVTQNEEDLFRDCEVELVPAVNRE